MTSRMCFGCMEPTDQSVCPRCGYPQNGNNQPHQLPVGTVLRNQYIIGKVLGQGGFGITYLAWDRYLDMKVAVKEFYPCAIVSRDCTHSLGVTCSAESMAGAYHSSRERFLREAKALAKFENNPAIVSIKSFFEENNTAYIIMEYVKGTSLDRYVALRGGRLTPEETFRLLRPVMDALAQVHDAGMVHRDISPDNIILHPMGGAKLLDFGAVREIDDNAAGQNLARSTEAILKHGFAPIEQYQSRGGLGPWTDVYALCATIWYCLTGQVPTDAPSRIIADSALAWDSIPGLTAYHQQVLTKGTALRAKDRYASVGQLCQELHKTVPSAVVTPVKPVITPPPAQKPPVSASPDWYCDCGYKNKSWHSSCMSCGKRKPQSAEPVKKSVSPAVQKPSASTASDWYCDCGYKNKNWHTTCMSCGKHKPQSAEPVKKSVSPTVQKAPVSASEWFCSCGYKNVSWHSSCMSCGKHK